MAEIKYVDWDGLVYYHKKVTQYIDDKFNDQVDPCLKFGGIFNLENVPSPGLDTLNYIYKIDEDFSVSPEDPLFVQSTLNHKYNAGTIIQVIEADKDIYLFDILFEVVSQTAITPDGEVDLSNYYTKDQVEALIKDLPTKEYVDNAIKNITIDTSNLATKEELSGVEEKIPSLEGYAKVEDIPTDYIKEIPAEYITEDELNAKGFITEHQSLEDYAKKTDIPNTSNFITMQDVEDKGYLTEIPDEYINLSELTAQLDEQEETFNSQFETITSKVETLEGNISDNATALTDLEENDNRQDEQLKSLAEQLDNIELTYVTNETLETNYITIEEGVTKTQVTTLVEQEVQTVVTTEIEKTVETVIQEKVDSGEITTGSAESINYDTF